MEKCLECGTEIPQTNGKRKKEFCNSTCRSNFWQKKNRIAKKQVTKPEIKPTKVIVRDLNQEAIAKGTPIKKLSLSEQLDLKIKGLS